jgi:hypothetical protein
VAASSATKGRARLQTYKSVSDVCKPGALAETVDHYYLDFAFREERGKGVAFLRYPWWNAGLGAGGDSEWLPRGLAGHTSRRVNRQVFFHRSIVNAHMRSPRPFRPVFRTCQAESEGLFISPSGLLLSHPKERSGPGGND